MNAFRAHELEQSFNVDDRPQPADHLAGFRIPTVVIMFSVIGLLIAANLILRIPDAGLSVEQFNTFPSCAMAGARVTYLSFSRHGASHESDAPK